MNPITITSKNSVGFRGTLIQSLGETRLRIFQGFSDSAMRRAVTVQLMAGEFVVFTGTVRYRRLAEAAALIQQARAAGIEGVGLE